MLPDEKDGKEEDKEGKEKGVGAEERAGVVGVTETVDVQTSVARVAGTQPPRGRDRMAPRGQGLVGAGGGGRLGGLLRIIRLDWVHVSRRGWAVTVAYMLLTMAPLAVPALSGGPLVGVAGVGWVVPPVLVSAQWMSARRFHLDGLCAVLGVRRGEVVAARYLVLLGFLAVAVLGSFLATAVGVALGAPGLQVWLRWVVLTFFMVLALGCLPPVWVSVRRPDLGAVLLAWVACLVGCGLVLGGLGALVAWAGRSWPLLDPGSASFLPVVTCAALVVGAAALVGSWRFTLRAYARQDL